MKIVLAGSGGLLGSNFLLTAQEMGHEVIAIIHERPIQSRDFVAVRADLSDRETAMRILREHRPDWVVNCAALTDVDFCERNPEDSDRINARLPAYLAQAAEEVGAAIVQVSSDAVHDGKRGDYSESDVPAPLNRYAEAKLKGEAAALAENTRCLALRTNMFGWNSNGKTNLAGWILASLEAGRPIQGFTDTLFNPLLVNDLSTIILELMAGKATGLFNLGAADRLSKYDFALALAGAFGLDKSLISPARQAEITGRARRPLNTTLGTAKAERALGRKMPTMREGIRRFRSLKEDPFLAQLKGLSIGATHAKN